MFNFRYLGEAKGHWEHRPLDEISVEDVEKLFTDKKEEAEEKNGDPSRYIEWANLMRRTFDLDVLECLECGGRMKLIALIEQQDGIKKILDHLGLPSEVPTAKPARPPPEDLQLGLFDSSVDFVDDEWENVDDPETYAE